VRGQDNIGCWCVDGRLLDLALVEPLNDPVQKLPGQIGARISVQRHIDIPAARVGLDKEPAAAALPRLPPTLRLDPQPQHSGPHRSIASRVSRSSASIVRGSCTTRQDKLSLPQRRT